MTEVKLLILGKSSNFSMAFGVLFTHPNLPFWKVCERRLIDGDLHLLFLNQGQNPLDEELPVDLVLM